MTLVLGAWAGTAEAQLLSARETARGDEIAVRLKAVDAKGVRLELYDPNEQPPRFRPAAVCFDRCELRAVPGRYLLRLSGPRGSDVKTSKRFLDLEESADVYIEPPSSFQRYLGLTLGILGPALVVSGLSLTLISNSTGERTQPWYTIGLTATVTGFVATPVGWVMFGTNGKPSVEIKPMRSP